MKPTVYVETSIPSFYYEVRSEPEMVIRKQWTRQWWAQANDRYELVTSAGVLGELTRGSFPNQNDALQLISHLPLLPIEPAITAIVQTYINHKLMPVDPGGDALHLAVASYYL